MTQRISISPVVSGLFSTVAIESGLTDQQIVHSIKPHIPHKTFSRLRINAPETITPDQLLMVSRLAQSQSGISAADVIAMTRGTEMCCDHPVYTAGLARTVSFSTKEITDAETLCRTFASESKRILLFDRGDSFKYLRAAPDVDTEVETDIRPPDVLASRWLPVATGLYYERKPRVHAILTPGSLARRAACGDPAIEQLIDQIECGENSLAVVNDTPRLQHRVFRKIFGQADAVTIFDRSRMVVYPRHHRSIRIYDATMGPGQASLIGTAIAEFARMRRFRIHLPTVPSVSAVLRKHLSYQLPYWRRDSND